jgi:hypothetical protein
MRMGKAALVAMVIAGCSPVVTALAYQGTAKDRAACGPDVHRYCSALKPGSDSWAFFSCLEANRARLSKACLAVLEKYGV